MAGPGSQFDDLQLFAAVARLRSMRRAADEYGISTSVVSRQIAKLEHAFGEVLFERRANGVELTAAGQMLLPRIMDVLHRLADMKSELDRDRLRMQGSIAIASVEGVTKYFLAPLIAAFRRDDPAIDVTVKVLSREAVLTAIEDYQAEIGIVYDHFSNPAVETLARWMQPLMGFVRHGHPLLAGPLDTQALDGWPCALPDQTFGIRRLVDAAYARRGLALDAALVANQLQILAQTAAESDWITFMPLRAVRAEDERGLLVPLDLGFAEFEHRHISVVQRKGRPRSALVDAFLTELITAIAPAKAEDDRLLDRIRASTGQNRAGHGGSLPGGAALG